VLDGRSGRLEERSGKISAPSMIARTSCLTAYALRNAGTRARRACCLSVSISAVSNCVHRRKSKCNSLGGPAVCSVRGNSGRGGMQASLARLVRRLQHHFKAPLSTAQSNATSAACSRHHTSICAITHPRRYKPSPPDKDPARNDNWCPTD
jgi:hypothetical protein